jgi:apolipoprotein D and lipocalin family protein
MKYISITLIALAALLITNCGSGGNLVDTTTVKNLEMEKFLGKWYEVARFPHSFENGLVGVTATYSMRDDGKIKVLNQGYKGTLDGELKSAVGKAKIPDKSKPANLKVAFFWFFYADYLVMELDSENYQWAMIGSSSDKYLWILSRTPQIDEGVYSMLLGKAKARGYKIENLIKVPQPGK